MKNFEKLTLYAYLVFAAVGILFGFMLDFGFWLEYTMQFVVMLVLLFLIFMALHTLAKIVEEKERQEFLKEFNQILK